MPGFRAPTAVVVGGLDVDRVVMLRITGAMHGYAWGSSTAIQDLIGVQDPAVIAEVWFGAHPTAPSRVQDGSGTGLDSVIGSDANAALGTDVVARFGASLPYLLKVIAAEQPLSLQVHPHVERAREGFLEEDAAGVPLDSPERNYKDRNHKPELVYALTAFEAVCGFRAPRRVAEMFATLETPLAQRLHAVLVADPSSVGIRAVFTRLLEPRTRPSAEEVHAIAAACQARLEAGSPSPRADGTVVMLEERFPGDPGVVTSLLLNPVTLQPGEALFVPAGGVHAYLNGVGVEVMASSDNVLRAGLTPKHVDVPELLRNVDYVAAPPIRVAPEVSHGATKVFYAPVDDFVLSITTVESGRHPLPGRGPRIVLCLDGWVDLVRGDGEALGLRRGQAAFVPWSDGALTVQGEGALVQAGVP